MFQLLLNADFLEKHPLTKNFVFTEEIKKFGIALTSQTHLQEIKLLLNQNEIKEIALFITVKKVFVRLNDILMAAHLPQPHTAQ